MTSQEIEAFLAITANGSITKAAEILCITQSALSRRLTALENDLGYKIITRQKGKRTITLTNQGEEFIPIALRWKAVWADAEAVKYKKKRTALRIAASEGPNIYVLAPAYRELHEKYPDVDLEIITEQSSDAYSDLENGRIDLAFVIVPNYSLQLDTKPAYTEKMLFVCNRKGPYIQSVNPRDLNVTDYIYCTRPLEFQIWFENWFGIKQKPTVKCDLIPVIEVFLTEGKWSIIPSSFMGGLINTDLVSIPLTSPPPDRTVYYAKHPTTDKKERIIHDFLKIVDNRIQSLDRVNSLLF
ncbi:LysR family transcriptional regulator [Lachnoclostridium pacaense]|uniref:LysR family transcriptional regulator n=1 Tax=Enterocloster hominis (ex Hitch et al. 2024) TaxID=1917870 RepID=UPI001D11C2B2|nr:LysR family transcriptional regulator [Lachnoclostridium pacaense]MCC2816353.1 LysR family transcriptional regulator [Lachnoclostridium pacaense]